jgi:hypothetical protein
VSAKLAVKNLDSSRYGGGIRPPEVLTELEVVEAEGELKALQRHALEIEIEEPANEVRGTDRGRKIL